jgi:arylsulfatase A-like enzyme/Flp pilus assembly protein TadD
MRWVRAIALLCAVSANVCSSQVDQRKPLRPDIFLITIDTLRSDHVHCYGYDRIQTPALDRLAKDGVQFMQAFTPSPITNSSHASILTGLMPSSHGVSDFGVPLSAEHSSLAELLKSRGYSTAAFIGSIILDSRTFAPGLNRGFDLYDNFTESRKSKSRWNSLERRAATVASHAEAWLDSHPQQPRFVWIHFYDPHDPYEPPTPFSQTYKDRPYDGEIAYADSVLGTFLEYLSKHDSYQKSIVIAVGDHGEGLGEHSEETHGIFLYDSTTHVPLIVKLPDHRNARTVVDAQVSTLDILPTMLDWLHVPRPERIDGQSLLPYLEGDKKSHLVLGETNYPQQFGWAPLRSVRTEGFKFIEAPRPELYSLRTDPGEVQNIYAPWDSTVQKSRAILSDWSRRSPPMNQAKVSVPESTMDELKALGYFGRNDAVSSTSVPEPSMLPDPKDHIQEQNLLHTAMIAEEDGRAGEARSALENLLRLNPDSSAALGQLGELELNAGEDAKAASHLNKARAMQPNDAKLALEAGRALEKLGDVAGASEAVEASVKLSPAQFSARLLLGQLYLKLKDAKAAEDQLQAAAFLQPQDLQVQLELAKSQIAQGKFSEALRTLLPLSRSEPNASEVFDLLSSAYTGLGRAEQAEGARQHADSLRKNQR